MAAAFLLAEGFQDADADGVFQRLADRLVIYARLPRPALVDPQWSLDY